MTTDAGALALVSLLLPAIAFLLLAVVTPLRRRGRPAAYLSILCATGSLVAAGLAWRGQAAALANGESGASRLLWDWLPAQQGALATVGVFADADSTVML